MDCPMPRAYMEMALNNNIQPNRCTKNSGFDRTAYDQMLSRLLYIGMVTNFDNTFRHNVSQNAQLKIDKSNFKA